MSSTSNARTRAMQNEYGIGTGTCKRCCNLQFAPDSRSTFICIAYGYREDVACTWDENCTACGLFNVPFLGIRPPRRPLIELEAPKSKREDEDLEQLTLL